MVTPKGIKIIKSKNVPLMPSSVKNIPVSNSTPTVNQQPLYKTFGEKLLFNFNDNGWISFSMVVGEFLRDRGYIQQKEITEETSRYFRFNDTTQKTQLAEISLNSYHPDKTHLKVYNKEHMQYYSDITKDIKKMLSDRYSYNLTITVELTKI